MKLKNNKKDDKNQGCRYNPGTFQNPFPLSDLLGFNRLIIAYINCLLLSICIQLLIILYHKILYITSAKKIKK